MSVFLHYRGNKEVGVFRNHDHYMQARGAFLTKHFALLLQFSIDRITRYPETVRVKSGAAFQRTERPGADHAEPIRFWIGG
jgi:hypothetical protein